MEIQRRRRGPCSSPGQALDPRFCRGDEWRIDRPISISGRALRAVAAAIFLALAGPVAAPASEPGAVARGAYLAAAAGCGECHTDAKHGGKPYAGGRALATPFGTFYTPNITPDRETGIGGWSDAQFRRALRYGVAPDGANYYPAFPYPSFTKIVDADVLAIKAYLFSLPPVRQPNRMHDLRFPFNWRFLLTPWKWLFFNSGPFTPEPQRSAQYNRGAYLVTALAHCGECHTPRNFLGASEHDRFLAGTAHGADGKPVPNITPDRATGIGSWSVDDIATLLKDGQKPDFDFVGGLMGEVVDGTAKLTDADRRAIAVYLKSLAPIPSPQAAPGARQKD